MTVAVTPPAEEPPQRNGRALETYGERKIETRIAFAPHTFTEIERRAKKHGITCADEIRRIIDRFFDEEERKRIESERIVVLDREQQMLRKVR